MHIIEENTVNLGSCFASFAMLIALSVLSIKCVLTAFFIFTIPRWYEFSLIKQKNFG
nr:MAG TPA: hypothetical protein [Caudoviricetes sp.]